MYIYIIYIYIYVCYIYVCIIYIYIYIYRYIYRYIYISIMPWYIFLVFFPSLVLFSCQGWCKDTINQVLICFPLVSFAPDVKQMLLYVTEQDLRVANDNIVLVTIILFRYYHLLSYLDTTTIIANFIWLWKCDV